MAGGIFGTNLALEIKFIEFGIRRGGENNAKLLARHHTSYAGWRTAMQAAALGLRILSEDEFREMAGF